MELKVENITKKYSDKTAVDGVSIEIKSGITGLLGANGAGKTTLMRMISDLIKPTEGRIIYDGVQISELDQKYRDVLGYLPQEFGFYPEFSVYDYLDYVATLKGLSKSDTKRKIDELLEQMTLRVSSTINAVRTQSTRNSMTLAEMWKARFPGAKYHVMDASTISQGVWERNDFPFEKFFEDDVDESVLNWKPMGQNPDMADSAVQTRLDSTLGGKAIVVPPELEEKMKNNPDLAQKIMDQCH